MISSGRRFGLLRLRSITSQSTRYHHYRSCATTWQARQTPPICRRQRLPPTRRFYTSLDGSQESRIQQLATKFLPVSCPGCGALTQWIESNEPGFYDTGRRTVKDFLRDVAPPAAQENAVEGGSDVDDGQIAASEESTGEVKEKNTSPQSEAKDTTNEVQPPFCDRCHNLLNHGTGSSVHSPSIHTIHDIISDSPYEYNHIYHVLDSADFPLSLIPSIYRDLSLRRPRSQNRRSKVIEFEGGKTRPQVHFVITRSDLLAPTQEQVNSLMVPITQILRDAVSTGDRTFRMGNVHLVSAHRGWWTKEVKEKIREHGGAVWLVGKTNVGKSKLIETIFPKPISEPTLLPGSNKFIGKNIGKSESRESQTVIESKKKPDEADVSDVNSLLPPAQPKTRYPVLPIVSSLAGTTASPIRIPFGERKGELIDLPGLSRGGLEEFAQEEHQHDLIMKKRVEPERITIKPGKSLLLGGLIRITPVNSEDIILAAAFTPIAAHLTSTEKAVGIQIQERVANIPTIAKENIGDTITSAGIFELEWDVTNVYGKKDVMPRRKAKENPLPPRPMLYKVVATDILIEGCGWVELVTQVRTKGLEDREWPKVEVFSPGGKFIGTRMPLNAYKFISGDWAKPKDQKKSSKKTNAYKPISGDRAKPNAWKMPSQRTRQQKWG